MGLDDRAGLPGQRWTRREFVRSIGVSSAAVFWPVTLGPRRRRPPATRDDVLKVGLVVPRSGPLAETGAAAALGAELGAAEAARLAQLFERRFELVTARATGPDQVERETRRLVKQERVFAILGGLDDPSCLLLSRLADQHGVLFFNVGCPDDALRNKRCRRTTFNVEASTAMYTDALAQWLAASAGLRRWYFVTPDSEAGAAVHHRARQALRAQGGEDIGKAVVKTEAPELGALFERLTAARPDVVFLGLRGKSQAAFLQRYNRLDSPFEVAGPYVSTAGLWSAPAEERAGIWPTLWHHQLFRYGAAQLGDRFIKIAQQPLDARGWASWMGVKILSETVMRAGTTEASALVQFLEADRTQFDGHKGKRLTFRSWDHQLRQPLYLVRAKMQAENRWDVFDAVAELPLGRPDARRTSQELLDQLGDLESRTGCRFGEAASDTSEPRPQP